MKKIIIFQLIAVVLLMGCTTTQKGATMGTIAGATVAGIVGHQTGHAAEAATIGGVIGGFGGYLVGDKMKTKFCPISGKSYDESVIFCPIHGVELKHKQKS